MPVAHYSSMGSMDSLPAKMALPSRTLCTPRELQDQLIVWGCLQRAAGYVPRGGRCVRCRGSCILALCLEYALHPAWAVGVCSAPCVGVCSAPCVGVCSASCADYAPNPYIGLSHRRHQQSTGFGQLLDQLLRAAWAPPLVGGVIEVEHEGPGLHHAKRGQPGSTQL